MVELKDRQGNNSSLDLALWRLFRPASYSSINPNEPRTRATLAESANCHAADPSLGRRVQEIGNVIKLFHRAPREAHDAELARKSITYKEISEKLISTILPQIEKLIHAGKANIPVFSPNKSKTPQTHSNSPYEARDPSRSRQHKRCGIRPKRQIPMVNLPDRTTFESLYLKQDKLKNSSINPLGPPFAQLMGVQSEFYK